MTDKQTTSETEDMTTVTLSIDVPRHEKLKTTSAVTRISMSEFTRIALDLLWEKLGDLKRPSPEGLALLYNSETAGTISSSKVTKTKARSRGRRGGPRGGTRPISDEALVKA